MRVFVGFLQETSALLRFLAISCFKFQLTWLFEADYSLFCLLNPTTLSSHLFCKSSCINKTNLQRTSSPTLQHVNKEKKPQEVEIIAVNHIEQH